MYHNISDENFIPPKASFSYRGETPKNILIVFIRNYEKKILCIDHEGGLGSSRSLFYLIQNIIQIDSNINFECGVKNVALFKKCIKV